MNQIIPATIEELENKERRMFENVATLTSSADFIKAVRESDIETAKKVLAINVLVNRSNFYLGKSHKVY